MRDKNPQIDFRALFNEILLCSTGVSQQAKLSLRDGEFSRGRTAILPLECKREFISRAASITGRSSHEVRNSCSSEYFQVVHADLTRADLIQNYNDEKTACCKAMGQLLLNSKFNSVIELQNYFNQLTLELNKNVEAGYPDRILFYNKYLTRLLYFGGHEKEAVEAFCRYIQPLLPLSAVGETDVAHDFHRLNCETAFIATAIAYARHFYSPSQQRSLVFICGYHGTDAVREGVELALKKIFNVSTTTPENNRGMMIVPRDFTIENKLREKIISVQFPDSKNIAAFELRMRDLKKRAQVVTCLLASNHTAALKNLLLLEKKAFVERKHQFYFKNILLPMISIISSQQIAMLKEMKNEFKRNLIENDFQERSDDLLTNLSALYSQYTGELSNRIFSDSIFLIALKQKIYDYCFLISRFSESYQEFETKTREASKVIESDTREQIEKAFSNEVPAVSKFILKEKKQRFVIQLEEFLIFQEEKIRMDIEQAQLNAFKDNNIEKRLFLRLDKAQGKVELKFENQQRQQELEESCTVRNSDDFILTACIARQVIFYLSLLAQYAGVNKKYLWTEEDNQSIHLTTFILLLMSYRFNVLNPVTPRHVFRERFFNLPSEDRTSYLVKISFENMMYFSRRIGYFSKYFTAFCGGWAAWLVVSEKDLGSKFSSDLPSTFCDVASFYCLINASIFLYYLMVICKLAVSLSKGGRSLFQIFGDIYDGYGATLFGSMKNSSLFANKSNHFAIGTSARLFGSLFSTFIMFATQLVVSEKLSMESSASFKFCCIANIIYSRCVYHNFYDREDRGVATTSDLERGSNRTLAP